MDDRDAGAHRRAQYEVAGRVADMQRTVSELLERPSGALYETRLMVSLGTDVTELLALIEKVSPSEYAEALRKLGSVPAWMRPKPALAR